MSPTASRLGTLILSIAVATISACGPAQPPPPATDDHVPDVAVIAYDLTLDDAVNHLMGRYAQEHPDLTVRTQGESSTSIAAAAETGDTDADLLIINAQVPLPSGSLAPISVRPWVRDPMVFFTDAQEQRPVDDILTSQDRIAMAVEASPLGQYTRFGLRKLERWEVVKPRTLRHSTPQAVIDAVAGDEATIGVVYASDLARFAPTLAPRDELEVTEAAERAFVLVAITAEGVRLAQWLDEPAQKNPLAAYGLLPTGVKAGPDTSVQ